MENSNEEIIEELYHEVGQMFFAGLNEDDVFKVLYERNLTEKVVLFLIKEAKNNIIKVSNSLQGKTDNSEKLHQLIEQINSSSDYVVVDLREIEKITTKEELLENLKIPCIAFLDVERVETGNITKKDKFNRQFAWKRKYEVEGTNVEHKVGMMEYLAKSEFDGSDYIDITMQDSENNYVGKMVFPNGETILSKVSPFGKILGSIEGSIFENTNN